MSTCTVTSCRERRRAAGTARRLWTAFALVIVVVAACGGSTALGYDQAPASLDPNSPKLSAVNVAFDTDALAAPASAPFVLVFENQESVSHNVSIYADAAYQKRLFEGAVFGGPATRWYPIPALEAGTYLFRCDLHPDMNGRIVAS